LVLERAKRLTEQGRQVFVLLDSLTRLARAYNKSSNTGRTMSGGMDVRAMDVPKRLFGSARAFEEGGSLTILGTALIETGSRMDDMIFQEFKGTGNMELVLDRKLADRRIYPAIDMSQSGTRKEERILPKETHERVTLLRRSLVQLPATQAMEALVQRLGKTDSNDEFLQKVAAYMPSDDDAPSRHTSRRRP
jgi:transcription termination factor Rho